MNKTDTLINALRNHYQVSFRDSNQVDSLVLAYLRGILGVLEQSDDKLASALEYHILDYTTK